MFHPIDEHQSPEETPYVAGAGPALDLGELKGSHLADIVVVGGGIAGCSAALHAAEAGASVVLVEGREIGSGASGRNAGQLAAATKHEPDEILRLYGTAGEKVIATSAAAPETVRALCVRHKIDCELAFHGIVTAAHSPAALVKLARRAAFWETRGAPLKVLDHDELAAVTGSRFFRGGVIDRRGASINPLAYVRGLAAAAIVAGARVHEQTTALSLKPQGSKWVVATADGQITASNVLLCANAYTDDLWPGLRQTIVPLRSVQFLTEPLNEELLRQILPGRQPMVDTRRVLLSARVHATGQLHFGSGASMRPGSTPDWNWAFGRMLQVFPQLAGIRKAAAWGGWMAMNTEDTWKMHELAPGVTAILGCNGRGVGLATMYGRDLARHAAGTPAADLALPFSRPKRIGFHALSTLGVTLTTGWRHFRDDRDLRASTT